HHQAEICLCYPFLPLLGVVGPPPGAGGARVRARPFLLRAAGGEVRLVGQGLRQLLCADSAAVSGPPGATPLGGAERLRQALPCQRPRFLGHHAEPGAGADHRGVCFPRLPGASVGFGRPATDGHDLLQPLLLCPCPRAPLCGTRAEDEEQEAGFGAGALPSFLHLALRNVLELSADPDRLPARRNPSARLLQPPGLPGRGLLRLQQRAAVRASEADGRHLFAWDRGLRLLCWPDAAWQRGENGDKRPLHADVRGRVEVDEPRRLLKTVGSFKDSEINMVLEAVGALDGDVVLQDLLDWMQKDSSVLARKVKAALLPGSDDNPEAILYSFCAAGSLEWDGKCFLKLCRDTGLIDDTFSAVDADLIFAKVLQKGHRRIALPQLHEALALVAAKKGVDRSELLSEVAACEGPRIKGTKAAPPRLHDTGSQSMRRRIADSGPHSARSGSTRILASAAQAVVASSSLKQVRGMRAPGEPSPCRLHMSRRSPTSPVIW
ncbi:unnamed protein product, partial [Effrenium voratum]